MSTVTTVAFPPGDKPMPDRITDPLAASVAVQTERGNQELSAVCSPRQRVSVRIYPCAEVEIGQFVSVVSASAPPYLCLVDEEEWTETWGYNQETGETTVSASRVFLAERESI